MLLVLYYFSVGMASCLPSDESTTSFLSSSNDVVVMDAAAMETSVDYTSKNRETVQFG